MTEPRRTKRCRRNDESQAPTFALPLELQAVTPNPSFPAELGRAPAEGKRIRRTWAVLFVAGILLASVGGAAIVIWQAKAHSIPLFYILGALMVVLGIGFSILHLSVSDEYLRQHIGGEENAKRVREMWRGGWTGALLGVAMIAAQYFLGSYIPLP